MRPKGVKWFLQRRPIPVMEVRREHGPLDSLLRNPAASSNGHVSLSKKVNKQLISGLFHIKVCFLTSLEKPEALIVLGLFE